MDMSQYTTKVIRCVECEEKIVIKSFRLLTGKNTSEGYVCRECLNKEKAAAAENETAE